MQAPWLTLGASCMKFHFLQVNTAFWRLLSYDLELHIIICAFNSVVQRNALWAEALFHSLSMPSEMQCSAVPSGSRPEFANMHAINPVLQCSAV